MDGNENSTIDINTGNEIRLTDNSPKEGDELSNENQVTRPLTKEEVDAIVRGYSE